MRRLALPLLVSFLCWMPSGWAGRACFEKSTGKWLGEYSNPSRPGICVRNWVTNNPHLGYTADQIEEREITELELEDLIFEADAPNRAAQAARDAKHRAALNKLKANAPLTDEDWDILFDR